MKAPHSSPLRKFPLSAMAVMASVIGFSASANAATIAGSGFTILKGGGTENGSYRVSVTNNTLRYATDPDQIVNNLAAVAPLDVTATGTIVDYRFSGQVADKTAIDSSPTFGGLSDPYLSTDTSISARNNMRLYTSTDPLGDWSANPNDTSVGLKSFASGTTVTGGFDISGLTEGRIYFFDGRMSSGNNKLTYGFTMSGTGLTDHTDSWQKTIATNFEFGVSYIDFTNAEGYETLNFSVTSPGNMYFAGTVMTVVPEPSPLMLISVAGVMLLVLRRRRCS